MAGLTFQDEADAANRAVAQLQREGVKTVVLVIHQGGFQTGAGRPQRLHRQPRRQRHRSTSPAGSIPSIKVIVSAHTHAEYRCTITTDGVTRLITSASSFGRILSDITLTIDDKTGELVQASAENVIVDNALQRAGHRRRRGIPDPSKEDPQVAGRRRSSTSPPRRRSPTR